MMPSQSNPPRRVAFTEFSHMAFIPRDDAASKWYSPREKDHFRRVLIEDARRASREINTTSPGSITPDQLLACVGIEDFITYGMAMRVGEAKRAHARAVLSEQRRQSQQGVHDPKKLANASESCSSWSKERAQKLAAGYGKLAWKG